MPFPRFDDGDVAIRFHANEEPSILHSHVLALHSPWFKASLSGRWRSGQENGGQSNRRFYELRLHPDNNECNLMREWDDTTVLMRNAAGRIEEEDGEDAAKLPACRSLRRSMIRAHQMMLKTMYHVEPELQLERCKYTKEFLRVLGKIAGFYGCSQIVNPRCDHYLRHHWTQTLRDCEKEPMELGMIDLITAKKHEARETRLDVDRRLFTLSFVDVSQAEVQSALSVWRQWLAEELTTRDVRVYRKIGAGDRRIIDLHDERRTSLVELIDKEDYKAMKGHLDTLFAAAKDIVEPLLVDCTKLQAKRAIGHRLLFTTISDDELGRPE